MRLFHSCSAWFAKSVPRTHIDLWLSEGGAKVDTPTRSTVYLFSNNRNDPATIKLQESNRVLYRSAWILECHLAGGRKAVGPFVLVRHQESPGSQLPVGLASPRSALRGAPSPIALRPAPRTTIRTSFDGSTELYPLSLSPDPTGVTASPRGRYALGTPPQPTPAPGTNNNGPSPTQAPPPSATLPAGTPPTRGPGDTQSPALATSRVPHAWNSAGRNRSGSTQSAYDITGEFRTPSYRRSGYNLRSPDRAGGRSGPALQHRLSVAELVQAYSPSSSASGTTTTTPYRPPPHGGYSSASFSHPPPHSHSGSNPHRLSAVYTDYAADRLNKRPRRLSTQSLRHFDTPSRRQDYYDSGPSTAMATDTLSETQSVVSQLSRYSNTSSVASSIITSLDEGPTVPRYLIDIQDPVVVQDLLAEVDSFVPNERGFAVRRTIPVAVGHHQHRPL
ncbi:hypothetical protein H4R33_006363 [Dimargaris cristalligena]|nr:hypothetical protein H4R33_006363 [Dimargaris cristalligena]